MFAEEICAELFFAEFIFADLAQIRKNKFRKNEDFLAIRKNKFRKFFRNVTSKNIAFYSPLTTR